MELRAPAGPCFWVTVWFVCIFFRVSTESREGPRGGRESEAAVLVIPEIFGEASSLLEKSQQKLKLDIRSEIV